MRRRAAGAPCECADAGAERTRRPEAETEKFSYLYILKRGENAMLGFSPFKKHANKFNYIPRYYDPEKEAREARRAELHGERSDDAEGSTAPGSTSARSVTPAPRAARHGVPRTANASGRWRSVPCWCCSSSTCYFRVWPRCSSGRGRLLPRWRSARTDSTYAPLVIVPNDYEEE